MDTKVASSIRDTAAKLIRLVQTRLKEATYQEPKGEAAAYKTSLPEPLQTLRAR